MEIRYLKHSEINKASWDELIEKSPQSKIYAFSWYLDCVADNWDALIGGDYEEAFPLPWNQKIFGLKQVYQPILSQQLGLFSLQRNISRERVEDFLNQIPKQFKLVEIPLNNANPPPKLNNWSIQERINIELPLNRNYEAIKSDYNRSQTLSNIRSSKHNLKIITEFPLEDIVEIHFNSIKNKVGGVNSKRKQKILCLAKKSIEKGKAIVRVVKDQDDQIHGVKLLFNSNKRLYNIIGASTAIGRKSVANSFILNEVIKEYSDSEYILDFEGSMLPGVASFFRGFGGRENNYHFIRLNRLPGWIRIIYKILKKLR